MGGSGSQNAAITSLKNNRNALRSKQKGFKHNHKKAILKHKKLKFIELPEMQISLLKRRIRKEQKKTRRNQIFLFWGIMMTIIVLFILFS